MTWHGRLDILYSHNQGKTKVKRVFTQAPLKIQRPFYPEGDQVCHSIILHTAGGIVGGDRLTQQLRLQPHSHVLTTTPAATKVYRSNGQVAKQEIAIYLEPETVLEWLPQETIVFDGAIYEQELRVELGQDAVWLGWDITRFGRSSRGERFCQGEWRNYTEVWQQGQPLWCDRQWLPGNIDLCNHDHGLGGKPLVGSLVLIGKPVSSQLIQQIRELSQFLDISSDFGVSQTLAQGVICRYRGQSTPEIKVCFQQIWQLLRQSVLKCSVIKPRIWT